MYKKMVPICLIVFLIGCTAPTQPIASKSLSEGINQAHSVFYDMSRIARQEILNSGAADAAKYAKEGNAEQAQLVVKRVFDQMNNVDWLHIQWERSRALVRIGQEFIWGQKGILDIVVDDWEKAKDNYEKENPVAPAEK